MAGYVTDAMADKMRKAVNGIRWEHRNVAGKRTVVGRDAITGEKRLEGESMYSYPEASLQAALDASLKIERVNNTTVKPFDLSFKHPSAHPEWKDVLIPPKNPILEAIACEVLEDDQKAYVKDYRWSSESKNIGGARELLAKGPDKPPFLDACPDLALIDETDEPIDDQMWDNFFDRDDVTYCQGVLASHSKNLLDDNGDIALFEIPRTMSDPGFIDQLCYIEPPDGKTHDLNMDPDYGENKSANRKEICRTTADYIYSKCCAFKRHYERYVQHRGHPTLEQTSRLIQESMKDPTDSTAIFTTFKGFEKLEEMSAQKVIDCIARRMIWAPGQMEAILGKMLLKNVTLSSFKRFNRGNAHGVEASNGGFTRMFRSMMENMRDGKSFSEFLKENDLEELWDFKVMLEEFGWRDDDLKKWDLMQFQVYMLLNLQFYVYSYNWSDFLDLDQATWLYLFIVLATIDTTVVSDLGFGPEIFVRILASGLFLTASGGSKTHDTLSHAYSFRQTIVAKRVWGEIKKINHSCPELISDQEALVLRKSFHAFRLGVPFVHFSDDFLQTCLRRGLCFGQLVNRSAFFARMFGLEFKVAARPWKSEIGDKEVEVLNNVFQRNLNRLDGLLMKNSDSLFKGETYNEPMNGITTEFLFSDYNTRSTQWYPLTSEIWSNEQTLLNPSNVGIKTKGVNFLKFHFLESCFEDCSFIVPIRDHYEMYHKLFFSKVAYKDPAQMLIKLRSYAYYTFQWPRVYNTFKRIHDLVRERHFPDLSLITNDDLLKVEIPRKLGLSLEEVVADFADVTTVISFYLPNKRKVYENITDLRDKILWSAYRSCEYDIWSLIRMKNICVDIKGVYGVDYKTQSILQDIKKREAHGLQQLGRERKKPPPRRSQAAKV